MRSPIRKQPAKALWKRFTRWRRAWTGRDHPVDRYIVHPVRKHAGGHGDVLGARGIVRRKRKRGTAGSVAWAKRGLIVGTGLGIGCEREINVATARRAAEVDPDRR